MSWVRLNKKSLTILSLFFLHYVVDKYPINYTDSFDRFWLNIINTATCFLLFQHVFKFDAALFCVFNSVLIIIRLFSVFFELIITPSCHKINYYRVWLQNGKSLAGGKKVAEKHQGIEAVDHHSLIQLRIINTGFTNQLSFQIF